MQQRLQIGWRWSHQTGRSGAPALYGRHLSGCRPGDVIAFAMHNVADILALSLANSEAG